MACPYSKNEYNGWRCLATGNEVSNSQFCSVCDTSYAYENCATYKYEKSK